MNKIVLDTIPLEIDIHLLAKRVRLEASNPYMEELESLVRGAEAIARPKAMYKVAFIESRGDHTVVMDGYEFTSRVLAVNLEHAHRVFAYVATCGTELEEWAHSINDLLHQYWANVVQEMALGSAIKAMNVHMMEHHQLGHTSTMAPGSLGDWPLAQQRPLFSLLGDVRETIGVRLSDSLLMIPAKSVSGIRFATEEHFESCQLCPRPECPGRRAPYDKDLYERRYR
jgi:hypothetical protein